MYEATLCCLLKKNWPLLWTCHIIIGGCHVSAEAWKGQTNELWRSDAFLQPLKFLLCIYHFNSNPKATYLQIAVAGTSLPQEISYDCRISLQSTRCHILRTETFKWLQPPGGADLVPALFMEQLPQVVQAAGDGALVCVRVLEVLVGDVGAGQEGALGLVQAALVHQDDSRVQVGGCGIVSQSGAGLIQKSLPGVKTERRRSLQASVGRLPMAIL